MTFNSKLTVFAGLILAVAQGCGEVDGGDETADGTSTEEVTATEEATATPSATPAPDALDFDSSTGAIINCDEALWEILLDVEGWTDETAGYEPEFTIYDNPDWSDYLETHVITDIESYGPPDDASYYEFLNLDLSFFDGFPPGAGETIFQCVNHTDGFLTYELCAFDFHDDTAPEQCWLWGYDADYFASLRTNAKVVAYAN